MLSNLTCRCLNEIRNNLPRTKYCFVPCMAQREIMRKEREEEEIKRKEKERNDNNEEQQLIASWDC